MARLPETMQSHSGHGCCGTSSVAVAMARGPAAGLALADEQASALDAYHLLHATRADLLRRLGRVGEARAAYERALELAAVPAEREFLVERLRVRGANVVGFEDFAEHEMGFSGWGG